MAGKGFQSIIQRALTGAIFVAIIIAALLYNAYAAFVVFGVAMYFSFVEYLTITAGKTITNTYVNVLKIAMMGIYALSYFYAIGRISFSPLLAIVPFVIGIAILELYNEGGETMRNVSTAIMGLVYIVLPFSLTHFIINDLGAFNGVILLLIFLLIWVNDSFAYLFGISLGKHRMWERISPKKSWEGFVGGAISTLILSTVFAKYFFEEQYLQMIGLAVIVIIFGTLGDLFESQLKRQFNIKDSGKALPGHGGFLDRFDSFLFIIPIALVYLELISQ